MIMGLPVAATRRINGKSMASNEAILYAGVPSPSSRSTAVKSNGVEKIVISTSRALANSAACHSNGVCAHL